MNHTPDHSITIPKHNQAQQVVLMKKNIHYLIIVLSLTSISLTGKSHYNHNPHGNAFFNTLVGISFTSGGLTTSTEATVVHNHFDSHHHGHWKKQAHAVLNDIKLYEKTNTLSPSLQHLIQKNKEQSQASIQEKISFIKKAITIILSEDEDHTTEDNITNEEP